MTSKPKDSRFSIPLPPGFQPPTGTKEGQSNEFTTTDDWRLEGDRLILVQIGDHKIKDSDHEDMNRDKYPEPGDVPGLMPEFGAAPGGGGTPQ